MKKLLNSLTSFTRTERVGLLVLSALLIVLIIIRTTMSLWVHPTTDKAQEEKLVRAWAAYKSEHIAKNTDAIPDSIDLNTADSAMLVELNGIGPVTAHNIVLRRIQKGRFTNIDQLKETGSFPEETFASLKEHLYIDTNSKQNH